MRPLLSIALLLTWLTAMSQSVLSSGVWYKMEITERGVHRIDYNYLQENTNFNLSEIDPATIKVYGNGAGMLPQENDAFRYEDLTENAILEVGAEDGSFDPGDYVLFFGEGAHRWDIADGHFAYDKHLYSTSNYYFLTIGGEEGLRVDTSPLIEEEGQTIDSFDDLFVYEDDDINILKSGLSRGGSGREWYGELFQLNVQLEESFPFDVPGFTGKGEVIVTTLGQSIGPSSMTVAVNGDSLGRQTLRSITPIEVNPYLNRGFASTDTFAIDLPTADVVSVDLRFNRFEGGSSSARLDKILLMAERALDMVMESEMIFRSLSSLDSEVSEYMIAGVPATAIVWNITDPLQPITIPSTLAGDELTFTESANNLQEYVVFAGNSAPVPTSILPLENQNIRSLSPRDGVIIAHSVFLGEAERLADFHRSHDGLDIAVIDVEQVYNEFSSGMVDITAIRDVIRHFYRKNSQDFRYALLFGDCSYDYLDRDEDNTNFVPIYESRNSTHPIESYSSDDFFGFMEEDEGRWFEDFGGDHTLEIGIGRLPVRSAKEATDVVNKILRYSTSERVVGSWKNRVTYVVDDGDRNIHVDDAEEFSSIFSENRRQLLLEKLYLDAFEQQVDASNERSPILREKVISALTNGTFTLNYIGHGNEFLWMDEEILDVELIDGLTNRFKLPLIMTATCQFGRYDDPDFFSGSERMLLAPNGGAIALITTTRPVFASSNELVNEAFHLALFERIDGEYPRLGDIVRKTKNASRDRLENRNFALLGDPFLQLRYPQFDAVVDEINGTNILAETDTLSAWEEVTISGRIIDSDSATVTEFDGTIDILLLDAEGTSFTLGQESVPTSFTVQQNPLFHGQATVSGGRFSATFLVTPNTSYRFDRGKITLYALDEEEVLEASGYTENLRLGGTDETPRTDNSPPQITMYVDSPDFQNGQVVASSSLLVAELNDEFGINISETAIHQNITLQINDQEPEVVNDFFQYALDSYQQGFVNYPLENLAPGRYQATIKVWDLYNNSSTQTVEFIVSDLPSLELTGVTNYPNPVKNETTFTFEHDRIGEELQITIDCYDMKGAIVEQLVFHIDDAPERIDGLDWDLNTSSLEKGMYLYRLTVRSTLDGAVAHAFRRLMRN